MRPPTESTTIMQVEHANDHKATALPKKDFHERHLECEARPSCKASASDVGGKFDTCAVSFTTPSAPGVVALNSYAMHRETTQTKPFTYAGACTIQVTGVSPNLVAKISCKNVVQVGLEGAPRNPIDAKTVATVLADVNCPL